jgi:hypothetical protein
MLAQREAAVLLVPRVRVVPRVLRVKLAAVVRLVWLH